MFAILAMFNVHNFITFWTYSKTKASCDGHVSALGLCSELADQEDCDSDDGENYHDHPDDDAIKDIQEDLTIVYLRRFCFQKVLSEVKITSHKIH